MRQHFKTANPQGEFRSVGQRADAWGVDKATEGKFYHAGRGRGNRCAYVVFAPTLRLHCAYAVSALCLRPCRAAHNPKIVRHSVWCSW